VSKQGLVKPQRTKRLFPIIHATLMGTREQERWVTFDCFGTLIDWRAGFAAILAPLAGSKTDELLRAYHQFEPIIEAERPHRLYKDVLRRSLSQAAAEVGLQFSEEQSNAVSQQWASLPLFDDVEEALAGLRDVGYKLAILTNCDDDLFAQTQRSFRSPFDLVVTAEQVRDYKPSLAHFRRFSELTKVSLDNWVHVACSWFHDIAPARDLAIKRIWLDRELSGDDPLATSRRILTATELPDAVDDLIVDASR
jgi:2-haloacid dehalogenase